MESRPAKPDSPKRASRMDWLLATLEVLRERGIEGVKVVVIARRMGLTSGSFYWHFRNVDELLHSVLAYWETELTEHIIQDALAFDGSPALRIKALMMQVIEENAALPDGAIAVWAKSDPRAAVVFQRAIQRRFTFAAWMFRDAGFDEAEARMRGRMLVTMLMGETTNGLIKDDNWRDLLEGHWRLLVNAADKPPG